MAGRNKQTNKKDEEDFRPQQKADAIFVYMEINYWCAIFLFMVS